MLLLDDERLSLDSLLRAGALLLVLLLLRTFSVLDERVGVLVGVVLTLLLLLLLLRTFSVLDERVGVLVGVVLTLLLLFVLLPLRTLLLLLLRVSLDGL